MKPIILDKTIKSIPLLGNILTGGKKSGLIETYFKINRKLSEPKVIPQPHKSLIEKPGSILKKIIKFLRIFQDNSKKTQISLNRLNCQVRMKLFAELALDVFQGSAGGGGATATGTLIMDAYFVSFDSF